VQAVREDETTTDRFVAGMRDLLASLGADPDHPDLVDTPGRWVRAIREMTAGYREDPAALLTTTFEMQHSEEMIAVTGVPFTSVCAHHLLPFSGTAAIAYIPAPGAPVVGLSKLPRVLDVFARRLQSQEQIAVQVTTALEEHARIRGAACVLRATHSCLTDRGARKAGAEMVTSSLTGIFLQDERTRAEFLALARA